MTESFVEYSAENGIAKVVLNRPEVLNCLNRQMAEQLASSLRQAASDDSVHAVWLRGAGRAFCAGQDLREMAVESGSLPPDLSEALRERYNPLIRAIRAMEKPIVCAVQGVVAGAGANMAFACDIVLAAEDACFVEPFCGLGLVPDSGGTFFLPRLIGLQRASAMCLLGETISAQQALAWGLIYRVSPPGALKDEALAIVQRLAGMPASGLQLIKRALNRSLNNRFESQLDLEAELQGLAGRTAGFREAVNAFLAKRNQE
ncbi:MAG TPA: enoyl-CoA hydratase-related protein [Terriglobia bacterium]|nr:enoyl-CoA hydratase-related protein [Terriglobia bacterium]